MSGNPDLISAGPDFYAKDEPEPTTENKQVDKILETCVLMLRLAGGILKWSKGTREMRIARDLEAEAERIEGLQGWTSEELAELKPERE